MTDRKPANPARRAALLLAAETGLDVRTCRKAIEHGADALASPPARDAVRAAASKLKIALGAPGPAAARPRARGAR